MPCNTAWCALQLCYAVTVASHDLTWCIAWRIAWCIAWCVAWCVAWHTTPHQALAERLQQTRERRGAAQARSAEVRLLPPLLKEHGLP